MLSRPFELCHTSSTIDDFVHSLSQLEVDIRIVMEYAGRYHEPVARLLSDADFYVSMVNPKLIKDFGNNSLRKVKSDKKDAVKITRYALDNWNDLRQYSFMDTTSDQLKTMNRQFDFYMKHKTALKNSLMALLDQTATQFPEYPVIITMKGVGPSLGSQTMTEIGDIQLFSHRGA